MKKSLILLWFVSLASTLAGIPYAFELQSEAVSKAPVSLPVLVLIATAQTAVLLAIAVYFGAKLARAIGLRVFALEETALGTGARSKVKAILKLGIPAGIVAAVAIYALDFAFDIPELAFGAISPALWKTLLASFYGGVVEEVLMRLFLVSLVAWLLAKLFKSEKPVESKTIMWSAIIVAAVIFGLGHLPVTAALTDVTPLVVVRAILLNGVGGLIFGWLYWKRGLEYGIAAHFTADIVLLAILPALF